MFGFASRKPSKRFNQVIVPVIELLENRRLLSGSVVLSASGVLSVNGSRKSDKISITVDRKHASKIDVSVNGRTTVVKTAKVVSIHVDGGAGNDNITEDAQITVPSTLMGGEGNDTIVAGGGNDVVDGGNGVDQCDFHSNSGVPLASVPTAVQTGLTTLAQGATITQVQQFHEDGQTYFGSLIVVNGVSTRIVVDANGNPVTTGLDDKHGGGDHHDGLFGQLTAVDTTASTVTVTTRSEHGPDQVQTLNVSAAATITVDGVATPLANLPVNAWVHLKVDPTDPTTVTAIQAFGKRVGGTVASVDTGAGTLTLTDHESTHQTTYNVSNTATVTINGTAGTLASLTTGMEVRLKFSADNTTVISIFADDNSGDGGGGNGGAGGGGHHGHEGADF